MEFFEKDLKQIIFEADKSELASRGLYLLGGRLFRQLKIGNYGIADLVHVEFEYESICENGEEVGYRKTKLIIDVIELKKEKIGISAFLQAVGYVRGIQRWMEENKHTIDVEYQISLIGKEVDTSGNFCYLSTLDWLNVRLFTYKYDFNGIKFRSEYGYKLVDEGF